MYYLGKDNKGQKPKKVRTEQKKWIDKLDKVISLYVRLRDSREFKYKYFRCISCGRVLPLEQADCGHYMSRRHMNTRFNTNNCHAECRHCNRFSADHLVGYRKNLVMKLGTMVWKKRYPGRTPDLASLKKFGEQQVDILEMQAHQPKKWDEWELEQLYRYYAAQVIEMDKERG
jgi:5-methylcytosine-specific restriction endonuclease McrA